MWRLAWITPLLMSCAPPTIAPNDAAVVYDDVTDPPARCVPGRTLTCACTSGAAGVQTCTRTGTFAPCECFEPDAGVCSGEPSSVACVCANGTMGWRACVAGLWTSCPCAPDAGPSCNFYELCNGLDDDCDGAVDESAPCPPGPVTGTMAVAREVFVPVAARLDCTHSLTRVWPSGGLAHRLAAGEDLPCGAGSPYPRVIAFAPNGRVERAVSHRPRAPDDLRAWDETLSDDVIIDPLTECAAYDVGSLAYDASGRRWVSCGNVYRDGAAVATGRLIALLPGGEMVVDRGGMPTLLAATGREIVRVDHHVLGGSLRILDASVAGESAWVAVLRGPGTTRPDALPFELVSLRFDASGSLRIVRRIELDGVDVSAAIALPDGTFVIVRGDPSGEPDVREIVAWLPDGSERLLFRDLDATTAQLTGAVAFVARAP